MPAPTGSAAGGPGNATGVAATPSSDPSKPKEPPPCPPVAPAPEGALAWITGCEIKITKPIYFEIDKDRIQAQSFAVLDAVGDILLGDRALRVEIRGHINHTRQPIYSRDLSKLRAQSVLKYLVQKKGVDPMQVTAKGYGGEVPLVDPKTEEGRLKNRRIEFIILRDARP